MASKDCRIFGDDIFIDDILSKTECLPERKPDVLAIIAAVQELYDISDDHFRAQNRERTAVEARGLAAWATVELSSGKLTELAKYVGRDPSTLTCAIRQIEKRQQTDAQIVQKMERLRRGLLVKS